MVAKDTAYTIGCEHITLPIISINYKYMVIEILILYIYTYEMYILI